MFFGREVDLLRQTGMRSAKRRYKFHCKGQGDLGFPCGKTGDRRRKYNLQTSLAIISLFADSGRFAQ